MARILLVDDDRHLCYVILDLLKINRHEVEVVNDGFDAIELLRENSYDLIVLDWNLPKISGVEICKEYRKSGGTAPIILLTARKDLNEKEKGFDSGADDYLTKPFEPRELYARVHALLRRAGLISVSHLEVAGIQLDSSRNQAMHSGQRVALSPQETCLLEFFMKRPDQELTVLQVLEELWPTDRELSPEDIAAYIQTLRRKLGEQCPIIRLAGGNYKLASIP